MIRSTRLDFRNGGDIRKCGIWGCGRIGSTVAYTLMQTGWFTDMVLIDPHFQTAECEATDLCHGLPFRRPMDIYAGDFADLADCGLILIADAYDAESILSAPEALPQRVKSLQSVLTNITLYNQNAILLVCCDPSELFASLAQRFSGFPEARVIGVGTVLDTARLKQMVGRHLGVDSRNVHTFIIGEHGENEFPVWSSANISGVDLKHFCDSSGKGYEPSMLEALFLDVRDSRTRIVAHKGLGNFAIAEAVRRIVSAIVHDESSVLPVSVAANGHYGLDDVYISLPCIVNRSGIRRVLEIPLNEDEERLLRRSAETIKKRLEAIGSAVLQFV